MTLPRRAGFFLALSVLAAFWSTSLNMVRPLATATIAEITTPNLPKAEKPCIRDSCDFVMFWTAGQLTRNGDAAAAYDSTNMIGAERSMVAPRLLPDSWFYPPPTFLLTAPLGGLKFERAFLLWQIALLACTVVFLRFVRIPWLVMLATLLSPAALLSIREAQLSLPLGALFVAGIMSIENHPNRGGAAFGTLILKPQIGLIAPILLLARREWRALATGAATVLLLCAAATLAFGTNIWTAFFTSGRVGARLILNAPFPGFSNVVGISTFWMARSLGAGITLAWIVQLAVALSAIIACYRLWRARDVDPIARLAVTTCLAALISPYGYPDDLCAYSIAIALLVWQSRRITIIEMILWIAPAFMIVSGIKAHLLIGPVVLIFAALYASTRLRPSVIYDQAIA